MTETLSKHEKNVSAIIHASTFCRFLFPFGNFLVPLILWMSSKNNSPYIDYNGKQALNFQISLLLYSVVLGLISVPFLFGLFPAIIDGHLFDLWHWQDWDNLNFHLDSDNFRFTHWWPLGITGLLGVALFLINIVYTILATIRTSEGQTFSYPLTIKFIR